MSRFDLLYRRLLFSGFFTKGWGHPENLKRLFEFRKILSDRETCHKLVPSDYPIYIDKETVQAECRLIEGHFKSPFTQHLPGIMPKEVEVARFQMVLPKKWTGQLKPVCLHLAGTGDHGYWRRRTFLARPLLKESGIASIILENPYYGVRKPKAQMRSCLLNVSDLFVMGGALILESLALFHWCERQGYGPLGATGISMGGHMASLAATNWPKPIALIPCLSWSTASSVFTQGVLSRALPWKLLQDQYFSDSIYGDEVSKLIHSPERNRANPAFQLGSNFAKNYPASIADLKDLHDQHRQSEELFCSAVNADSGQSSSTHSNECNHRDIGLDCSYYSDGLCSNLELACNLDNIGGNQGDEQQGSATSSLKGNTGGLQARGGARYHTMASSSKGRDNKPNNGAKYKIRDLLRAKGKFEKSTKAASKKMMQDQAGDFMRGVMDECTHLGNFSMPVDPNLIIIVLAKNDAYVPTDTVLSLEDIWPGAEVRYVDSGHIGAFLFKQGHFRKAIVDAFNRQTEEYYS